MDGDGRFAGGRFGRVDLARPLETARNLDAEVALKGASGRGGW